MNCIFNENDAQQIHNEYFSKNIINKNGTCNICFDTDNLEQVDVEGFRFIVHKYDTCIADYLRNGCLFEKFQLSFIKQFIHPNKNIIDLGANIGTHSIIYSNYTTGNVYSFEPQKMVFDILNKNIQCNNCNNIIPYNCGASNINNKFYMNAHYDFKENQGAFKIDENLNKTNGLEIDCVVIDELNLNDISYVKIDVEGHEYYALQGMKNLLIRNRPTIMIEIHDFCSTKNETINFLLSLGYSNFYKLSYCDYLFPTF
jgi:FkbM family methyltransferase